MIKRFTRILPAALLVVASVVAVEAQKVASSKTAVAKDAQAEKAVEPEQFRRDFIKAAEEYRASLEVLVSSYETSLKKQAERHETLKELYTEGLLSRREIEASEASLVEARGKVEGTRKEIASAEATLEAARRPPAAVEVAAVDSTGARIHPAWTTGSAKIDALIRYNGQRYGVDPYLIYCVMHQESRFGAGATSYKGAQGLMQLMPGTAARYGVTNSYDPAQNIMGGTRYLKDLQRLFGGRIDLMLAGYNAGEGAVMKYGNRVPPYRETQNYVRTIGTRYTRSTGVALTAKTVAPKPQQKKAGSK